MYYAVDSATVMGFEVVSDLVDILALKLGEKGGDTVLISLDADGGENLLDVGTGRRGVAAELEEKVSSEVLHFDVGFCLISDARG
jgi:hypothetical protein